MNDRDRFFIRQCENWKHLRRLGVRHAICIDCTETDPRCFIGALSNAKIEGNTLFAQCERCKRKTDAPKDGHSIKQKWKALRKAGVRNSRCYCGEDNPFTFEFDHTAGRKSSNEGIGVCINCHLKRTSRQLTEYEPDNFDPKNPAVVMRNMVRGTIEHLELNASHLRNIEEFLHNLAAKEPGPPRE